MNRVIIILTSIFIMSFCASANAAPEIKININGRYVNFATDAGKPYLDENNRTQVPLKATMEEAGAIVKWDGENQVAIVEKNNTVIKVPIGKSYIFVDDKQVANDTQAVVKNGRTYLPISVVLKNLAFTVKWDDATQTVYAVHYGDLVKEDEQLVDEMWENAETAQDVINSIDATIDHERFQDQITELTERQVLNNLFNEPIKINIPKEDDPN
ncbi:copper amine oxidase N-terminal domain-containing protein [Desulforamulus ruminis]|uniref:Copper amine oxidase-like domain-containing protein n=1 Tax=Desulforamulus ruminis (strain ATCC 23193 / DSM 2154 / NCIMB 8452 / DL) TaxID=696281 RepID=F6DTR1_DESRL|nr:copper amine oxidase N-terminal domain-containing protein [Desulforamulus ruminis]AEG61235.1 copper amine oxidase-like domain-containing protein [Desulforamulus ruminis DSM 2154]